MYSHTNRNFHFNQVVYGGLSNKLPQQNLIANYVMQGGELVDKVGGAGQELLFPCFKGDGSSGAHNISIPYNEFNFNITGKFSIAFDVYVREKGTFQGLIVKREITSANGTDWFVNIGYGNLSFNISNGSNIYQVYFSVENNTKYSIVVTWDGTLNVSSNLKIYANNVIKRSTSITASPQTSTAGVVIGSNKTGSTSMYYTYSDISNFGFYSEVLSAEERATLLNRGVVTDNREAYFPLIGHGYGFKADNSIITGTPSNATCFEGLTLFNPREGYNLSSGNNLVIPQSRQNPLLDVEGEELDDFKGGNAMPPYAVYNAKNLTGDFASVIKAIMLRNDDATITDRDNQKYGYDADNEYYWNVSTLLRLPEFIKSLQPDWYLFLKKRVSDGALEQIVVYRSGYKNALFFNGTDSYIDLGNSTSSLFSKNTDFHLNIKFKVNSGNILTSTVNGSDRFAIGIKYGNYIYVSMYNGSNYTNLYHSFTLANVAELIVDYVDGVLSATINGDNLTSTGTNADTYSGMRCQIGRRDTSSNMLNGSVFSMETDTHKWEINGSGQFILDSIGEINGTIYNAEWIFDEDATPTRETTYAKLTKILKATKDTTTKVQNYEAYISCGELSTTGLKTGSAMLKDGGAEAETGEVEANGIKNGDFATGSFLYWYAENSTVETGITFPYYAEMHRITSSTYITQANAVVSGKTYLIEFDYNIDTIVSNGVRIQLGASAEIPITITASGGWDKYGGVHTASATGNFYIINRGNNTTLKVTNINVKEITGMVELTHSVSSPHEFRNDVSETETPAPILKKDSSDKFYWDWSVDGTKVTSEIDGVETELTGTYKYIQRSDGVWSPVTLVGIKEITHDDFTKAGITDYKMYGFISTNTKL